VLITPSTSATLRLAKAGASRGSRYNRFSVPDEVMELSDVESASSYQRGDGPTKCSAAVGRAPEGGGSVRIAEPDPAGLDAGQRFLRPPGDRASLLLGDERHDADGEVVGLRHVGGDEAHAAVAEGEQQGGVAGKLVEPGDDMSHIHRQTRACSRMTA